MAFNELKCGHCYTVWLIFSLLKDSFCFVLFNTDGSSEVLLNAQGNNLWRLFWTDEKGKDTRNYCSLQVHWDAYPCRDKETLFNALYIYYFYK